MQWRQTIVADNCFHADGGEGGRYLRGIDSIEYLYSPLEATAEEAEDDGEATTDEPSSPSRGPRITRDGNVLAVVSPANQAPVSDYSEDVLLHLHPGVFPYGTGKRPAAMSEGFYFRLLLDRWPLSQFGHNVALMFDMFNILQRHAVNTQARVRIVKKPALEVLLGNATIEDMQAAVTVSTKRGDLSNACCRT